MNCYPQANRDFVNSLRFNTQYFKKKRPEKVSFFYFVFLFASAAFIASSSFC
jgi:hypothetical protein